MEREELRAIGGAFYHEVKIREEPSWKKCLDKHIPAALKPVILSSGSQGMVPSTQTVFRNVGEGAFAEVKAMAGHRWHPVDRGECC